MGMSCQPMTLASSLTTASFWISRWPRRQLTLMVGFWTNCSWHLRSMRWEGAMTQAPNKQTAKHCPQTQWSMCPHSTMKHLSLMRVLPKVLKVNILRNEMRAWLKTPWAVPARATMMSERQMLVRKRPQYSSLIQMAQQPHPGQEELRETLREMAVQSHVSLWSLTAALGAFSFSTISAQTSVQRLL